MPDKKNFRISEKLQLPDSIELINSLYNYPPLQGKPKALTDSTLFWEHTDQQSLDIWKYFLLNLPIFKEVRNGEIKLRDPRYSRTVQSQGRILLDGLCGEMINYYRSKLIRVDSDFNFLRTKIDRLLDILSNNGLMEYQIIKKDTLRKILKEVRRGMKRWQKIFIKYSPDVERGQLEGDLYPYFKKLTPKLSDDGIWNCIAHILNHLGIEKGNVKQISERIRKRVDRKRFKKDLDVDKLKIALSQLR